MNLYMIADKVADTTSSIFEAKNHATMARNIMNNKGLAERLEEYSIYQVGRIQNYGTLEAKLELYFESWKATQFVEIHTYKGE